MADSTVTIGGDISDLQAKLKQAGSSVKSFGTESRASLSGIDLGKAFAVTGGIAGLTSLVKIGFDFNKTMKDGEVAIGNVLKTFKGLSDAGAKSEAARVVQLIAEAEPRAAGGLQELTQGFIASAAAAANAGLNVEENVDLVARFANALSNSGLPLDQLNQEIRSVLTAQISGDSFVGKLLEGKGLNNERIKQLTQEGTLYGEIVKQLGAMGEAGDTSAVAFSTLESGVKKALGALTSGMFDEAVEGAKTLSIWIETNKDLFTDLGVGISKTIGFLGNFAAFINDVRVSAAEGIGGGISDMLGVGDPGAAGFMETFTQRVKAREAKQAAAPAAPSAPGSSANAGTSTSSPTSSTAASSSLLAITREIEAVEKMREQIGQRQFQSLLRHLTPTLQIEALEKRITAEKQKQAQQQNAGPVSESAQLENLQSMLELEDRLAQAKQARAEAATAAAEEERQANEKLLSQQSALADILAQTEILRAQAAGDDKKATALQREAEIQANVKSILDATNLSEQEALKLAREQQDLKDQIAKQGDTEDTAGRIDASIGPGGAEGARQRAEQRMQEARDRVDGKGIEGQFGREDSAQRERFAKQFGPGADPRQNPAALDAAKNQQAAAQPAESGQQIANQILEQVKAIIPLLS